MATIYTPSVTTTSATQYILAKYYDKTFLARLLPELRWYQVCEKKRLPANSGKTIKFSAFRSLAVGTRLSEATIPTAKVLSTYNVTAALAQFGDFSAVSDLMEVTGITSTIKEATGIFGEHSALTIDTYLRNVAWGGGLPSATSRISASLRSRHTGSVSTLSAFNGKVGGFTIRLTKQCSALLAATGRLSASHLHDASAYNAATQVTLKDIRGAVAVLRGRNVKPFSSDGYFAGIAHPQILADLANDTSSSGWVEWQKYTSSDSMMKGEVGRAEGVRWTASTNAIDKPLNTGAKASASIMSIVGKGALGSVDFENSLDGKGKNFIIIKRANQYNTNDPLSQIAGTVGWKATLAACVLNTSCGIHLLAVRN